MLSLVTREGLFCDSIPLNPFASASSCHQELIFGLAMLFRESTSSKRGGTLQTCDLGQNRGSLFLQGCLHVLVISLRKLAGPVVEIQIPQLSAP